MALSAGLLSLYLVNRGRGVLEWEWADISLATHAEEVGWACIRRPKWMPTKARVEAFAPTAPVPFGV